MFGLYNNESLYNNTQATATNWQLNSPHSLYWQDVVARILYSKGLQDISPNARQLIAYIAATGQNTLLGLQDSGVINFNAGNPVADFIGTHRALIARPLPITSYSIADGGKVTPYGTSMSYGPGNNSLTAATLIQRAFAADFRNENNQIIVHRTQGVPSRSVDSWLPLILDQPGFIKDGHMQIVNLSKATTSSSLGEALKIMRSKGATEESIERLRPVQKALSLLEENGIEKGNAAGAIKLLKEAGYEDSMIELTLLQRNGRNTNYLVQTEKLRKVIKDTYAAIGENLKDLSDLFDTEDPAKILAYAKGAGFGNIVDKNKAAEVRAQLREIATIAATTGQSPQEVVRDRIQISNGLSAMYGGRVADKGSIDVVHNALISAQQQGDRIPYSKEEAGAAAVRSVANVQNIYSGAILMEGVMAEASERGVDLTVLDQMKALQTEFDNASLDEKPMVALRMESFLRKNFGDHIVDNPAVVAHYMSKHGSMFLESHYRDIARDNIKNRIATAGHVSGEKAEELEWLSMQDLYIFGSYRDSSEKFNQQIKEGDTKGAVDNLLAMGMTKEAAEEYVTRMSAYGTDAYDTHIGFYLRTSPWIHQDSYSLKHKTGRETVDVSRMLAYSNSGSASSESILTMLSGELAGGTITERSLAAAHIGLLREKAMKDAAEGESKDVTIERFHKSLRANEKTLRTVSFGTYSEQLGKFEFSGPNAKTQREALRKLLGLTTDAELDALLANPAELEKALNTKGYVVAGGVGVNGEMYAYNEGDARKLADKYVEDYGGGLVRSFAAINGKDSVSLRVGKNNKLERVYRVDKQVYTEKELLDHLSSPEGFELLYKLAAEGDKTAVGLLSDKFKTTIKGASTDKYGIERPLPEAFTSLLNKETVTVGDIKYAANAYWGTMNFTALGSGRMDLLKAEGIVGEDGKYTREITIGGRTFKPGDRADEDTLKWRAENDPLYLALESLLKDRTVDPTSDEWQSNVKQIVDTLMIINGKLPGINQ